MGDIKYNSENILNTILNYQIDYDYKDFNQNIRQNIIDKITNKYLNKAYNIYYVKEIDFSPILKEKLPLVKFNRDEESSTFKLNTKLFFINKNDTVECKLMIKDIDNIKAINDYVFCNIIPNNDFDTIKIGSDIYIRLKNNKEIKNYENVEIKIIDFKTANHGEFNKIIATGEFIID